MIQVFGNTVVTDVGETFVIISGHGHITKGEFLNWVPSLHHFCQAGNTGEVFKTSYIVSSNSNETIGHFGIQPDCLLTKNIAWINLSGEHHLETENIVWSPRTSSGRWEHLHLIAFTIFFLCSFLVFLQLKESDAPSSSSSSSSSQGWKASCPHVAGDEGGAVRGGGSAVLLHVMCLSQTSNCWLCSSCRRLPNSPGKEKKTLCTLDVGDCEFQTHDWLVWDPSCLLFSTSAQRSEPHCSFSVQTGTWLSLLETLKLPSRNSRCLMKILIQEIFG